MIIDTRKNIIDMSNEDLKHLIEDLNSESISARVSSLLTL